MTWEEAGFDGYDGYAWYRLEFVISQTYRRQIELHARDNPIGPYLILTMGAIDDVDETFFNDTKIGSTGSMLPDYATAGFNACHTKNRPLHHMEIFWAVYLAVAIKLEMSRL